MTLERLPNEIWQTILRYSIAVPVFFDADPIESQGFYDYIKWYKNEAIYWRSERHRNILRRVCVGWDYYLRGFNNRLVRLEDVAGGHVSALSISQAIRLECRRDLGDLALIEQAIQEGGPVWPLEILSESQIPVLNLILRSGKVPRLRDVVGISNSGKETFTGSLSNLRFLYLYFLPHGETYQLVLLTTLSIQIDTISTLLLCHLPSLKHLSLYIIDAFSWTPINLIALLEKHGQNLVTFFDISDLSDHFLPSDMWSLCPKIQRFQTVFKWPPNFYIPTSVRELELPMDLWWETVEPDVERFPSLALKEARVSIISFVWTWKEAMMNTQYSLISLVIFIMNHGFSLHDRGGVTFQDFIVGMLHHRKLNRRTFSPYWTVRYTYF